MLQIKERLHSILTDMITEHNYGDPIPLSRERFVSFSKIFVENEFIYFIVKLLSSDGEDGHMSFLAIRKELTKRIFLFLGLPALILFGSILWLAVDWPGFLSAWIRAKFSDRRKRPKGPLSTNEPAQKISFKSLSVRKVMNKVMGRVRRSCSAEKMKSLATLILVMNDRDTVC